MSQSSSRSLSSHHSTKVNIKAKMIFYPVTEKSHQICQQAFFLFGPVSFTLTLTLCFCALYWPCSAVLRLNNRLVLEF